MFKGKTILVVDDEPDLREILKDEFEYSGALVLEASNGKSALEIVQKNEVDCIVSDIRMPGGDGIFLLKAVKSLNPKKPSMILTTGFADIHPSEAYNLGVEGFITKPFDLDAVRDVVAGQILKGDKRWIEAEVNGTPKKLTVKIESLVSAIERGVMQVGRGGLFLTFDSSGFYSNDLLDITFSVSSGPSLQMTGLVRWVQDADEEHAKAGAGIEFLKLTEDNFQILQNLISTQNPVPFIPQG